MSELQKSIVSDRGRAAAASPEAPQGVCEYTGEIAWRRADWELPVGYLAMLSNELMVSSVAGLSFTWHVTRVPYFRLEHKTSLLLLQGKALSSLLIPNHTVFGNPVAHVLLRVDPWKYWSSVPALTGLVLAKLGDVPDGISSDDVLSELIRSTAP